MSTVDFNSFEKQLANINYNDIVRYKVYSNALRSDMSKINLMKSENQVDAVTKAIMNIKTAFHESVDSIKIPTKFYRFSDPNDRLDVWPTDWSDIDISQKDRLEYLSKIDECGELAIKDAKECEKLVSNYELDMKALDDLDDIDFNGAKDHAIQALKNNESFYRAFDDFVVSKIEEKSNTIALIQNNIENMQNSYNSLHYEYPNDTNHYVNLEYMYINDEKFSLESLHGAGKILAAIRDFDLIMRNIYLIECGSIFDSMLSDLNNIKTLRYVEQKDHPKEIRDAVFDLEQMAKLRNIVDTNLKDLYFYFDVGDAVDFATVRGDAYDGTEFGVKFPVSAIVYLVCKECAIGAVEVAVDEDVAGEKAIETVKENGDFQWDVFDSDLLYDFIYTGNWIYFKDPSMAKDPLVRLCLIGDDVENVMKDFNVSTIRELVKVSKAAFGQDSVLEAVLNEREN